MLGIMSRPKRDSSRSSPLSSPFLPYLIQSFLFTNDLSFTLIHSLGLIFRICISLMEVSSQVNFDYMKNGRYEKF